MLGCIIILYCDRRFLGHVYFPMKGITIVIINYYYEYEWNVAPVVGWSQLCSKNCLLFYSPILVGVTYYSTQTYLLFYTIHLLFQ